MKRFTVPCDFAGEKHDFHLYVDMPSTLSHPIYYQTLWLKEERGGVVPEDVIDSFNKLYDIATEHNDSFEDLCVYALGEAEHEAEQASIKKSEGNILHIDFKKARKMAAKRKKSIVAKADYYNGHCRFFDIIDLDDEALRSFSSEFSTLLLPPKLVTPIERQTRQFAQHMLRSIFLFTGLGGVGDKKGKAIWAKKMKGFVKHMNEGSGYNLAVCGDVVGEHLTFADLATLEYFLYSDERWKNHISEQIHGAIAQWADKKTTPKDIFCLGKFGVDEKAIVAIKKTLKTAFHPL